MEALGQQRRCAVLLGTTGDSEADEPTENLSQKLQHLLGEAQKASDESAEPSQIRGEATLHIAPNAHEELRWGHSPNCPGSGGEENPLSPDGDSLPRPTTPMAH